MATKRGRALGDARKEKNDEFYTRLTDIERELKHYKNHFENKVIFCNCDDPFESDFFKYFVLNFKNFGLKKIITTCYGGSPILGEEFSLYDVVGGDEENKRKPYKAIVTKVYDATGDGKIQMDDIAELFKMGENELTELDGDGDFRSEECIELLKEADIVVTNPPFSLFREYVTQLIEYKKKFVIIGNQNALTYKEVFPLIKDEKIWLGNNNPPPKMFFVPNGFSNRKNITVDEQGRKMASFGNICWFTNLDISRLHEELILIKRYNPNDYPTYENFDGIEVDKVQNIPCDYKGVMGVPITFISKHNPEQFEIIGFGAGELGTEAGVKPYDRKYKPLSAALRDGIPFIYKDGKIKVPYARVFIKNKNPE